MNRLDVTIAKIIIAIFAAFIAASKIVNLNQKDKNLLIAFLIGMAIVDGIFIYLSKNEQRKTQHFRTIRR